MNKNIRGRDLVWSKEASVSPKAIQEVVNIHITGSKPHVVNRHPSCFTNLLGIINPGHNLFLEVAEVVFADGQSLIGGGYDIFKVDAGLFICLTDCAIDVCLTAILVPFGERPFTGLFAAND